MNKLMALFVFLAGVAQAQTPPAQTAPIAEWNDAAALEIEALARQVFQHWQEEDAAAVRAAIATDSMLGSYDNDMKGEPVKITDVDEQIVFAQRMWRDAKKMGAEVTTRINEINCRATATMGVCAMEFDVDVAMSDGTTQKWPTRGTMICRLGEDGWKATHWHASPAVPPPPTEPEPPAPITPLTVDRKSLEYVDVPDSGGVKAAIVWEDPATGTRASFRRFPKRWKRAPHYHSSPSHNVIINGACTITGVDEVKEDHKKGAWVYLPSKWIHSTECRRGATVLSITYGPQDAVMVDEKGNPLPEAAPAPAAK